MMVLRKNKENKEIKIGLNGEVEKRQEKGNYNQNILSENISMSLYLPLSWPENSVIYSIGEIQTNIP